MVWIGDKSDPASEKYNENELLEEESDEVDVWKPGLCLLKVVRMGGGIVAPNASYSINQRSIKGYAVIPQYRQCIYSHYMIRCPLSRQGLNRYKCKCLDISTLNFKFYVHILVYIHRS